MAILDEALKRLGECFLIGVSGLELSDETSAFLSRSGIGGVVLFSTNYETPAQLAELTNQIQECKKDLPLWIAIDHEGGRVQRLRKPFTRIPDAQTIAATHSPKLIFDLADMIARELKAVGINVNFGPVADLNTNPKNPVIGARSYGSDPDQTAKIVTAMVRGHLVNQVQPCVKHFPGHGDTSTDSHIALPKVDTSLETLREREFHPFVRAFKSRCSMVMTAHILNPNIDPKYPATLSKRTLREILRGENRYTRLIISDDMEMKAITEKFGADEAPKLAIEAGCDLLVYRTEPAGRHAYSVLRKALEAGTLDPHVVLEAAERSRELKKDTLLPYHPVIISEVGKKVGTPANQALVDKVAELTGS